MSLVVDAHQHFWDYGTYQTSWMEVPPYAGDPAFQPLRRSFQPADLIPELKAAAVQYTVTIEAADGPAENEALLTTARNHDWIAGVVGWAPLTDPDNLERTLDACAGKSLVGIRHLINVEPDPDWIIRPDVLRGLQVLAARGLTFDYVGILPRHLEHVPLVAQCIPNLRIVIDHLGKPPIAAREFEPWSSLLARAARLPNVFAKASGLDAGAADHWTAADIAPYIDRALELFGPERPDVRQRLARGRPARRLHQGVARDQLRACLSLTRRTRSDPRRHRHRVLSLASRGSVAVMRPPHQFR